MSQQPYYSQVVQNICAKIVRGEYREGESIPSIRNLAVEFQLNPNTIQRGVYQLQQKGIIQTVRGTGLFVQEGAQQKVKKSMQEEFWQNDAPEFCYKMDVMRVSMEEFAEFYRKYQSEKKQ